MAITVRGYGVNEKGDQILATFTLSEVPDPAWLRFFKERSAYSRFDYTTVAICGTRLQVELPERGALSSLVESVEGIIRAANLDYEFHGP